jgi:predicted P-loop ATPase
MSVTPLRKPTWLTLCQFSTGDKPSPLPNVFNALVAMRNGDYKNALWFDEMLQAPVILEEDLLRPLTDDDCVHIQEWMQGCGLRRIGRGTTDDGINTYARERRYHPLRDWLESLKWDGVRRTSAWLTSYLGCQPSIYHQRIGEMFLISMVARIFEPGCKVDYMLILEGPQGINKSKACRILAGRYFSDSLPELSANDKDVRQHLRGKWLIEISEMHAFSKAEQGHLKSFLTRQEERYRPPFSRLEVFEPRQCVFIGTSNKEVYLRDETGERRSWPIKCGTIYTRRLEDAREQLFAEAVHLYKTGHPWWPDRSFESEHIAPEQAARYEGDAWEDKIDTYIADKTQVTTAELATRQECIGMPLERVSRAVENRIGAIMRLRQWVAKNNRKRFWQRPDTF